MMKRYDTLSALSSRLSSLAVLLLLSLFVFSGCEKKAAEVAQPAAIKPDATKPGEINLRETRLAAIPQDYDKWVKISFSGDGQQVFYGVEKNGKKFIVVGNEPGKAYEDISFMVNSPDGRRFAFGGMTGGKKRLVVDNKELRDLYHEEVAPAAFSPDGRFVACEVGGLKEKKWFIVVSDGENEIYRSKVYPDTFRSPSFSPDGRLLVFELGDDKAKTENYKRTVFFLDVSARKIIKERLYTNYLVGAVSFSSDSSRVIYDIQKDGKKYLVLQDFVLHEERTAELTDTFGGQAELSPDGKHIIYRSTKDGKEYFVVSPWEAPAQKQESGPYEAIVLPVFGPGPMTVAYHAMNEGKWRTMIGGREGAKYDGVGDAPPVFSPDGAKIAYPARKGGQQTRTGVVGGEWVMVVSRMDRPAGVKEGPAYDMAVSPVFSPDGKRIAYRARKGPMENAKRFIVIADAETGKVIKEAPVGDEIWPPVWSADNKAVAYGARQGRELWWRVETVK